MEWEVNNSPVANWQPPLKQRQLCQNKVKGHLALIRYGKISFYGWMLSPLPKSFDMKIYLNGSILILEKQSIGNGLRSGINQEDNSKKSAFFFSPMQTPKYWSKWSQMQLGCKSDSWIFTHSKLVSVQQWPLFLQETERSSWLKFMQSHCYEYNTVTLAFNIINGNAVPSPLHNWGPVSVQMSGAQALSKALAPSMV